MVDVNQFVGPNLNLDLHYNLKDAKSLHYLLNGDIQGKEGNNNEIYVQNMLSNELCASFPDGFELKGTIKLNTGFIVLLYNQSFGLSRISYLDENNCVLETITESSCLNFQNKIQGTYKINQEGTRIYWVDGLNPNRYLDIKKENGVWIYPKKEVEGTGCSCSVEYMEDLDCDMLRINRCFEYPCMDFSITSGSLPKGTYQIGYAYGEDNLLLTDFKFGQTIKLNKNKGIKVNISCTEQNPFSQFKLVLIANTKSEGLVVYDLGFYTKNVQIVNITSLNYPVLSTEETLLKRTYYDYSKHIVNNSEHLLLGSHKKESILEYQKDALLIEAEWVELKVPIDKIHLNPSLMRDEIYGLGIEWFDKKGQSKGSFHIPGKPNENFSIEKDSITYKDTDIAPETCGFEIETVCDPVSRFVWEVENSATVIESFNVECDDCINRPSKIGRFGFYETKNIRYPNTLDFVNKDVDLRCKPIRHHRVPSHNLSHIHDMAVCESSTETYCASYDNEGNCIDLQTITNNKLIEAKCVNIIGVRLKNVRWPDDPEIIGYRIVFTRRDGYKTILHKGLMSNMWEDASTNENILYPNYPYNDLNKDVFLSITQTTENDEGANPPDGWVGPQSFKKDKFTYHSPDIHYLESNTEKGERIKILTEEIGKIDWEFNSVYKHPEQVLENTSTSDSDVLTQYAKQFDSVANFSNYLAVNKPFDSNRKLNHSQYLLPIKQFVNDNKKVNNYFREESFYFDVNKEIDTPTTKDLSRFLISQKGTKGTYCDTLGGLPIQAVHYYTSVIQEQPDIYGNLEAIEYKPFNECINYGRQKDLFTTSVFTGGDVYISKHTIRRKMPLFTEWLYDVPFDTEYDYTTKYNVYKTRFWFDTQTEVDDRVRLDQYSFVGDQSLGNFYININGTLDFFCESEFIGNLREEDVRLQSTYYPVVSYETPFRSDIWRDQELFLFDLATLKTNIESSYQNLNKTPSISDFTVIYSTKNDIQSANDKWLQYLPLNYTILPKSNGEFTGMFNTTGDNILFLFEHNILLSQVDYSLSIDSNNSIYLGQGDLFSRRLRSLGNDLTGYTGCVDPLSMINTRYGTFWFDRYRRKWFRWIDQLEDVTSNLSSWFERYLSDNNRGYEGLISIYDNYTDNIYLTNKESNSLNSWTLSYKPRSNGWISWHSFIPDFYLSMPNTFISTNENGFWKHNDKWNYQTYYGKVFPFEVGFTLNSKFKQSVIQSLQVFTEWIIYNDYLSPKYYFNKFFDKLLVYNNFCSTGIRNLFLKDRNDETYFSQNQSNKDYVEVTQVEDQEFRFNKIDNLQEGQPNIVFEDNGYLYDTENIKPELNYDSINKDGLMRGKWFKVHLRSTADPEYKKLIQLTLTQEDEVYK